jgi:hypothetical protein
MRRVLLTGVLGLLGVVGTAGTAAVAASGPVAATAAPVLFHVPIIGKHITGVGSIRAIRTAHGVRYVASTGATSTNWSGYADEDTTFQEAVGTWTVPAVNCAKTGLIGKTTSYAAFWVGLDGYTSSSVEQTGTDSDCVSGTPSYYGWYEMYPAGSVDLSTSAYPVKVGNQMTATITYTASSSTYALVLHNDTTGWTNTFSMVETGLANSSAEWVAEAPSTCIEGVCRPLTLAKFGKVTFTSATTESGSAVAQPISNFTNAEITMTSEGGATEAAPSALNAAGNGFSVTYG